MLKKNILLSCYFLILLFIPSFVSASFVYYDNDIERNYSAGDIIKGIANISLNGESPSVVISSNFIGNISLLELLKANKFKEGDEFDCNTNNCLPAYQAKTALSEVALDREKIIGLKIAGDNIEEITLIKFKIIVGVTESCNIPLLVDILNNGANIIGSGSYLDRACSARTYGCFDPRLSNESSSIIIEDFDLCENITVGPGPAYRVGARIINSTQGRGALEMSISDSNGKVSFCTLPELSAAEDNLDCIAEFSSFKPININVCIKNNDYFGTGGPNYKIRTEKRQPICGSQGRDFEIFARPLQFNQTEVAVNNDIFLDLYFKPLEEYAYEYLSDNYELNRDRSIKCDPYCVVPIKLTGPQQTIKFADVDVLFRDGGLTVSENNYKKFYDVATQEPKINSDPIKIDLSLANFVIPIGSKENKFKFYIGDGLVFEESIKIKESFDFNITPRFAFLGLNTKFEIVSVFNITSSTWDFGDGAVEQVNGKSAAHNYLEEKSFNVKVEAVRKDGARAIKIFSIVAGKPQTSANFTIRSYRSRLTNLIKDIDSFPSWMQTRIKEEVPIGELKNSLDELEIDFKEATSNEEYIDVISSLLELKIPNKIAISKHGILPMAIGFENINGGYIEEISGEEAGAQLKESIVKWFNEHYTGDVEFSAISAFLEDEKEDIMTKFAIKIEPKAGKEEDSYLFIDYPFESIVFKENYGQKAVSEGAGAYIPIKPERQTIEFFAPESLEAADLGVYISPEIRNLGIVEENKSKPVCLPGDNDCKLIFPWTRLLLWLGIVLLLFIIVYIILQQWYKKNYEKHLFKNKDDLYNLINFIYNSRVAGLHDLDIKKKLKGVGWSGEQITYAFKKIDGKRTGMWEIPLFKFAENRRVREEIAKRQQGPVDARFIKQPRF